MKTFSTIYELSNGSIYPNWIQAEDLSHATRMTVHRGLNEVVQEELDVYEPYPSISEILNEGSSDSDLKAALHAACHLGFMALSAQLATVEEILGDEGLVHRLSHLLAGDTYQFDKTLEEIIKLSKEIEDRIPGWPK